MSFTLTREYVDSLAAASASGDFGAWLAAIDPEVKWRIGGSEDKGAGKAGVYVRRGSVSLWLWGLVRGHCELLLIRLGNWVRQNRDQVVHHFLRHFPEMFPDGIKIETVSTEVSCIRMMAHRPDQTDSDHVPM